MLLFILVTSWFGLPAAGQRADAVDESRSGSECVCPKEGRWNVQNLEGWMDCTGPINPKRKFDKVKDKGTIWILEEDC